MKTLTISEAFAQVLSQNIEWHSNLNEYKAVRFQDRAYNDNFPVCRRNFSTNTLRNHTVEEANLLVEAGFVIDANRAMITVETEYGPQEVKARAIMTSQYRDYRQEFSTEVTIGGAIKRKQKKYPNGMYMTYQMLRESTSYAEFKAVNSNNMRLMNQMAVAQFLVELSATDYIDEDLLEAVLLEKAYRELGDDNEVQLNFLTENNFTGLENFNYEYSSRPDGYGHCNVSCMSLDFESRSCYVAHGNSGD